MSASYDFGFMNLAADYSSTDEDDFETIARMKWALSEIPDMRFTYMDRHDKLIEDLKKIVANVNLDMPLFLYPLADIIAFGSEHSSLEGVIADAVVEEGFVLTPDPMPEEVIFIRSDQYSFVKQGVPAIYLDVGTGSRDPTIDGPEAVREFLTTHYHKPSDDLTRTFHVDSMVRFVAANHALIRAIADAPEAPRWRQGNFFGETFGPDRVE